MKVSEHVSKLAASATLAVSAKAAAMKGRGIDVVSLAAGEPDFDTPQHIKDAGIRAIQEGQTKYSKPASGLPAVKEAICRKLRRENGLEYSPDQVIVTAGAKNAVQLAMMAVLNPGDEMILPVPYWVSYPEQAKMAGAVSRLVEGRQECNFEPTIEQLAEVVTSRTRMLVLNSPSNPGGFVYSPSKIREIAEFLKGREIAVLSDEIYDRLLYGEAEHLSIASVNDEVYSKTITIGGGSKTYSMTGWRIGFAAGPEAIIKGMAKMQSQRSSGAATFTQIAFAEALNADQACVEDMRVEFAKRGAHMAGRLSAMAGVECLTPAGAFYCFPNVSGTYERLGVSGSLAFADKVIEEAHVAVVPGVAFGNDAHVRFSFATSMEQIDKGLDRLEKMLG